MSNYPSMTEKDFDIAIIYSEAVNFRPARKTTQRVGDRDRRCLASYREAICSSLDCVQDSFCSGLCSDCAEPCSLYEAGILAGV